MGINTQIIGTLMSKLGTWGLALVLIAIISSMTALLSAAMFNNVPIVYENGKLSIGSKDISELNRELRTLREENENSIAFSTLSDISSDTFKSPLTKEIAKNKIQSIINEQKSKSSYEGHYAYKLFLIELRLQQNGGSVDTKVDERDDSNLKDTYLLIQEVLRRLSYYKGPMDGTQKGTNEALVTFQKSVSNIPATDYGIFGLRTLEAIRSRFLLKG